MGIRRSVQRISALFVAIVATLVVTGTPAQAGPPFQGVFPQYVLGCGTNVRVGNTISIYDYTAHNYYGWAEWRYSTSTGGCADYQWVVMHFTITTITSDYYFYVHVGRQDGVDAFTSNVPSPRQNGSHGYFDVGGYATGMAYAKSVQICSQPLNSISVLSGYLFYFGNASGPQTFCA